LLARSRRVRSLQCFEKYFILPHCFTGMWLFATATSSFVVR
jgi:hypothetical protein